MYCITDQQVDYILNDIRRNGVETEDLQLNLLDHVCCIIEQNLEGDDDFEAFYHKTIRQFYKSELREIEEETINLLTFKNFYKMKKVMIVSGAFSVGAFISGSIFKIMHWPGASVLLTLGLVTISFLFLPLMVLLKTKDTGNVREKLVLGIGALVGMLYFMSTLSAVMHWPMRTFLWLATVVVAMFIFIPLYFFTGIRKAENKLNAIIMTILFVALTGQLFTMIALRPPAVPHVQLYTFIKNEQLLKKMQGNMSKDPMVVALNSNFDKVKAAILESSTGKPEMPNDIDNAQLYFKDGRLGDDFLLGSDLMEKHNGQQLFADLKASVEKFNAMQRDEKNKIPVHHSVLENTKNGLSEYTNLAALNSIAQLQMYLATAEMKASTAAVAAK